MVCFSSFLYVVYKCGCVYTHCMQACVAKVKGRLQVLSSVTVGLISVSLMMAILVRLARQQTWTCLGHVSPSLHPQPTWGHMECHHTWHLRRCQGSNSGPHLWTTRSLSYWRITPGTYTTFKTHLENNISNHRFCSFLIYVKELVQPSL